METRRSGGSRQKTCDPIVCRRKGDANTLSLFGSESASRTASFTSPIAAMRIYGDPSSEGEIRSRRIWSRRTDGVRCRTQPRIRKTICRVDASGCALHNDGRIVVKGMIRSGDSSAWESGAIHNTFRRTARVESSATFDCKQVRIVGKRETKTGMIRCSDAGACAISTKDAKEGFDWNVLRSQPRLLDAPCDPSEPPIPASCHNTHQRKV